MKRANSHKYNVLLVKDDVGKAKPFTRRLPHEQFVYGKPEIRDIEDAGQGKLLLILLKTNCAVASLWNYSRLSELKMQDKDFKRLNKCAITEKATTAHVSYESYKFLLYDLIGPILLPSERRHKDHTPISKEAAKVTINWSHLK